MDKTDREFWASEKWWHQYKAAQYEMKIRPDAEGVSEAWIMSDKLITRNSSAHHSRWTFRAAIFLMAWVKFLYALFVARLAWNLVVVPFTGWHMITTLWGALVLRVAVAMCFRAVMPTRHSLDLIEAGRRFERGHLWFDSYMRKWEVIWVGIGVCGALHLFLSYAPLN